VSERDAITNVNEALERLNDAEYMEWCRKMADKHFAALIAKRWPHLVRVRTPRQAA
jgi:hypothetical protein